MRMGGPLKPLQEVLMPLLVRILLLSYRVQGVYDTVTYSAQRGRRAFIDGVRVKNKEKKKKKKKERGEQNTRPFSPQVE